MFYRPGLDDHGLPYNPFKALITPRPIGWISTLDGAGQPNLAPYSYFNAIGSEPPLLMYSSSGPKDTEGTRKDSLANIRETGEFVHNVVPRALQEQMNRSAAPFEAGQNEFDRAGLEMAPCQCVAAPRVLGAPASLEVKLWKIIDLPGDMVHAVIGEVVGVHIDEAILVDGKVDVSLYQPLARMGYQDYAAISEVFQLKRPKHAS